MLGKDDGVPEDQKMMAEWNLMWMANRKEEQQERIKAEAESW